MQKLLPDNHNLEAIELSFTESWPSLDIPVDVVVLSLEHGPRRRKVLAGFIVDVQPSSTYPGRFRFYVDRFRVIGEHDLDSVSDASFYGNGGGGGSRVYVENRALSWGDTPQTDFPSQDEVPEGAMERRLVWVRKNHHRFRDPVWRYWESRCAVTDARCDGLLIASHIYPWAKSNPREKTDHENGLLLSVPLDALFDRGWISFADTGHMLIKKAVSLDTRLVFGLGEEASGIKRTEKMTSRMCEYLRRHRAFHGFAENSFDSAD